MSKIAGYLREHMTGEVLTSAATRQYYSTDASMLSVSPSVVAYPRGMTDVRKAVRFCWQLAERGHRVPLTARGRGTDFSGAALGQGIISVFPAHMNRILELDTKQQMVRLQPGVTFRTLQDTVRTHGFFLPPYPASYDYSSIGGAIANNAAGEKSVKYGNTRDYVTNLEVILANGDVIQTGRISKRELNKKKGLTNFEGEIYRQLDGLIADNWDELQSYKTEQSQVSKNASGYALADVKRKDGSFDLTPLFVGSQGTLGVITESILKLEPYMPVSTMVIIECHDLDAAESAVAKIMPLGPSALEMMDGGMLKTLSDNNPALLKDVIGEPYPDVVLLAEFDDMSQRKQNNKTKKAAKAMKGLAATVRTVTGFDEQETLWAIRRCAAAVMLEPQNGKAALPFIEDAAVPREKFKLLLSGLYTLLKKYGLDTAIWGHAGDANLHVQPLVDLSQVGERQKVFKLMDDYYKLVIKLGGTISAEHGDGRLRTPYLEAQHGKQVYDLFKETKKIFDPYNILNPGVKFDTKSQDLVNHLREQYSLDHWRDFSPHN